MKYTRKRITAPWSNASAVIPNVAIARHHRRFLRETDEHFDETVAVHAT